VLTAVEMGNSGKDDRFQFDYCSRNKYILVTSDADFDDDNLYPFSFGENAGIVIVRSKARVQSITSFLNFVLAMRYPKQFFYETKFVLSNEGCVMRGRDARTREVNSLQIVAGKTTVGEVTEQFSWYRW
jgi:hypothetical protein